MTKENKESWHYALIATLLFIPFYISFAFKDYMIYGYLSSLLLCALNYKFTKKKSFLYIHKPYYISLFIVMTTFFLLFYFR